MLKRGPRIILLNFEFNDGKGNNKNHKKEL